jgi:hypothetical protein
VGGLSNFSMGALAIVSDNDVVHIPFPNCPTCNKQMHLVRSKSHGVKFKCAAQDHECSMSLRDAVKLAKKGEKPSKTA